MGLLRCRQMTYSDDLPQISVVFIFVNEALSVILRSVHSVVNHTPSQLLKEVILVDDNRAPTSPVICVYARRAPLDTVKGARMRPGEGRTEHGDTAPGPTGYAAGAPVGPGCPPGSIHWSLMMGMWGEGLRVVEVFCKKSP
ncbi:GALNT9 [Cervus elaphus hippelaphus]|uniref:GALNT9 n=1 Tax=Cervus elaphus hippelaphus TaxID=46360 RepID=A0A212D824_CEREH|nr:GALNT9 [Cervus elaphus hippelaphus]